MTSWQRYLGQAGLYGFFLLFIGYFSNSPDYVHLQPELATIKLSLRHPGQRLAECRTRTPEEIAKLAPNMRIAEVCPRERSPLLLEMELDDKIVFSEQLPARGLHDDGLASAYRRLSVSAGEHRLKIRLKDHLSQTHFPYQAEQSVNLKPAQVLLIDFDSNKLVFNIL